MTKPDRSKSKVGALNKRKSQALQERVLEETLRRLSHLAMKIHSQQENITSSCEKVSGLNINLYKGAKR